MGKIYGKLFVIFVIVCFILMMQGCGRKKTTAEIQQITQELKNFKMEFFDNSFRTTLTGIAAEKNPSNSQASVSRPSIEIKSKNFIMEIKTGAKGTGEVFLDPSTQAVIKIVIQGGVTIVQKNPETSQVNFSASCEKLTYMEKEDIVVMEGSPQVIQGQNQYSANRITYNMKENKLNFEGNVQVRFKRESSGSN
ncbi:MAG: LptA/OstA family protein [Candidatus Omnitrophica bacterium]|jgi:lipopolysaccharide export system protein LptA|nr:LptA/OstA family protein [Candidatus Omnitrophota bacterium]